MFMSEDLWRDLSDAESFWLSTALAMLGTSLIFTFFVRSEIEMAEKLEGKCSHFWLGSYKFMMFFLS